MRVLLEPAVSSICAVNNAGACGSHPRHPGPLTHHLGKLTGGASIMARGSCGVSMAHIWYTID